MQIPLVELRFCVNSTCVRQGSLQLLMGLQDYLRESGLQGIVRVAPCGCLGGCSYGPNMAVPPSPRVFLAMDLEKTKRLLARLGLDQPSGPGNQGEG